MKVTKTGKKESEYTIVASGIEVLLIMTAVSVIDMFENRERRGGTYSEITRVLREAIEEEE